MKRIKKGKKKKIDQKIIEQKKHFDLLSREYRTNIVQRNLYKLSINSFQSFSLKLAACTICRASLALYYSINYSLEQEDITSLL